MPIYQVTEYFERYCITAYYEITLPIRNWGWAQCQRIRTVIQQFPIVKDGWREESMIADAPLLTCRFTANSDEPIIYFHKKREIGRRVPPEQNLTAEIPQ